MTILPGKIAELVVMVLVVSLISLFIYKKPKAPEIRKVPALDAIEEAIERSSELNRPVVASLGSVSWSSGPSNQTDMIMASMSILQYVARLCARMKVPLWMPVNPQILTAYHQSLVEEAYRMEGAIEYYKPEQIQWMGYGFWTTACNFLTKLVHQVKPGACIIAGPGSVEMVFVQEEAANVGALTISGAGRTYGIPLVVLSSDYMLWGEELMCSGAYISRTPALLASVWAQDICKVAAIILILVGAVLLNGGFPVIVDFLGM